MGVDLPQSANVFLPIIPSAIRKESPALYEYLRKLDSELTKIFRGDFNNVNNVAQAVNSGTSGTFVINSGGHIHVTSGIVISVSTT